MMNEERYAQRIRQALNHNLQDIPPSAARRLEAARHIALSKQKQTAKELVLATNSAGSWGNLRQHAPEALRQLLAILALLLGMWISFYWHSTQYVTELEEVDSALLSDDLPPEAFMDDDFFSWLTDDSPED